MEKVSQIDVSRKFQELFGVDSPFDDSPGPTVQPAICVLDEPFSTPSSTAFVVENSERSNIPTYELRNASGPVFAAQEPATGISVSTILTSSSNLVKCIHCDFEVSINEVAVLQNHISRHHLQYLPYICTFCGAKGSFESWAAAHEHIVNQHAGLKVRVIQQLNPHKEILLGRSMKACYYAAVTGALTNNPNPVLSIDRQLSADPYSESHHHQKQLHQYTDTQNSSMNHHQPSPHTDDGHSCAATQGACKLSSTDYVTDDIHPTDDVTEEGRRNSQTEENLLPDIYIKSEPTECKPTIPEEYIGDIDLRGNKSGLEISNPENSGRYNNEGFTTKTNTVILGQEQDKKRARRQCPYCPRSILRGKFKQHLRFHAGESVAECGVCHKKFSRKDNYNTHMKIHQNIKDCKCPHCPKAFTTSTDLKRHVRIHTREMVAECFYAKIPSAGRLSTTHT